MHVISDKALGATNPPHHIGRFGEGGPLAVSIETLIERHHKRVGLHAVNDSKLYVKMEAEQYDVRKSMIYRSTAVQ